MMKRQLSIDDDGILVPNHYLSLSLRIYCERERERKKREREER